MKKSPPYLFVWLILTLAAQADVTLASLFQDHAVLQRDQPVPMWGTAGAGEKVTVEFRGQSTAATAGADGRWRVVLQPMPASAEPAVIVVRGRNTLTVTDVLTGDVWLASGQSNMEWRVDQAKDAAVEIAAARHPLIRQFDVANVVATSPQENMAGSWVVCSPDTAGKFSAVAYYFARDFQQAAGVPVGIINSSWGGTPVEAWMSAESLAVDSFRPALARWQQTIAEYPQRKTLFDDALVAWTQADKAAAASGKPAQAAFRRANPKPRAPRGPGHHWTPAGLYNGMIAPLVPYALAGAIWYQAESNADYPEDYAGLFTTMITQWRTAWGRELPFYFVQIANFNGTAADRSPGQWAWLREAQSRALVLPRTGMAVIIDIGTPDNIHPKNKQEVGRRLALLARHDLLGENIGHAGPTAVSAVREGITMRVRFSHADGLKIEPDGTGCFMVAGADRSFFPAQAVVDGDGVVVWAAGIPAPVAVRYAWSNAPEACLKNGAGLPASPFRTDDWEK